MSPGLAVEPTVSGSSTSGDDHREDVVPKKCGLIQCRKTECNLQSHRQFAASRRQHGRAKEVRAESRVAVTSRHQPNTNLLDSSVVRIERQIQGGFATLPFKQQSSPLFRELVRHYFNFQIDRLIQLFSPHLDRRKYKSTMVEHALSNDVFCICITANAKTDMLMRGHIRTPDRDSEIVYAATAYVLRQKLNNVRPTDLDWMLVLVVALVGFDLAFNRVDALKSHHDALRQLITAKGGIRAVGHILPYVLNTDRFLALFTGRYPIFKQTPLFPPMDKEYPLVKIYGKAFETGHTSLQLDQVVLDFCLGQCEIIHLMQSSHISLTPGTSSAPAPELSAVLTFLYKRDRLACIGACLYAEYHEAQNTNQTLNQEKLLCDRPSTHLCLSKSRCVVLATLMIEYAILHGGYYTVKGPFLASQLKAVLEAQSSSEWVKHIDMLIWILFVAVGLCEKWDDRPWAVQKLRHWLSLKYQGRWPRPSWEKAELASVESFVWSRSLNSAFFNICDELTEIKKEQ